MSKIQISEATKFTVLALLSALLIGIGTYYVFKTPAGTFYVFKTPAKISEQEILGAWDLKTISGDTPTKINIKSWQVEFSAGGNWSYSGSMTGQFEGMQLKGFGTYRISGNEFQYTAGENSGKSLIEIKDGLLVLSPDPVVKPNGGKDDVRGEYERAK